MISHEEIGNVCDLEIDLVAHGVSAEDTIKHFTSFLVNLIEAGGVKSSNLAELKFLLDCLQRIKNEHTSFLENGAKQIELQKVWRISDGFRISDPAISELARCAVYCFIDEKWWASDNQGEETPLFEMYSHLVKINTALGEDFKKHFSNLCLRN